MPLFRNTAFRAFLACSALADTGFWTYSIAQGWLVLSLTNSPFWLGVVAGAGQLPFAIFALYGGSLADRFERRTLVAAGNAILATIALATTALVASGHATVAWLTILAFGIGTVIAIEHPIHCAWLYDLVHGAELGRAIALSSLEWSVARTIGPALGGIAIATVGIASGFGAFAFSHVPMVLLALFVPGRRTGAAGAATNAPVTARTATFDAVLLPFCLLVASFTIGIAPYITLLPDISKNVLHLDARGYGLLSAAGGAGAIAGAATLAAIGDLHTKGRIIPIAMFAGAVLLLAFTYARTPAVASALLFLMGAVDTLMYALANTYVQECAGQDERGRANGYFSLAFLGGIPIGNLIIGALAARVGSDGALAITSGAAALGCGVFWFAAPRAREAA